MLKIQNKKAVLFSVDSPTPSTVPGTQQAIKMFVR